MQRKANQLINVAIPADAHQEMKRQAENRGMKLREYQRFLVLLSMRTTARQQREAYEDFVANRAKASA